jgi:serine/tyrosine/threonine adenylyltransferase
VPFAFDHSYAWLPERFYARVKPSPVAEPRLLAWNEPLAELLGLAREDLMAPEQVQAFAGNRVPDGAEPLALAYAGHQFGRFVPQLGDGRAILLGEIVGRDGVRRDVQLKGAGPTPFSRGGDGRAAIGPVLREYLVSEAMSALGVPTTRALAAVATGEQVYRDEPLPGAVLTRVASSHLRVGTFEYFAARDDHAALVQLMEYTVARHYPHAAHTPVPALGLLDAVMDAQARLVARWLALGFVHGVMNTDNTSIAGETLDYGPCAFLDGFDPNRTFSSIDQGGRYAFQNQPSIALWNLARLAETLLPLIDADPTRAIAAATALLEEFPARFTAAHAAELRKKLGLCTAQDGDDALAEALLLRMAEQRADFTLCFRRLADVAAGADTAELTALFSDPTSIQRWLESWRARSLNEPAAPAERAAAMRAASPAFIPRNHRIEEMITAARNGDLGPFERLLRVLARPYDDQPDAADLAEPPGEGQWSYRTFCGT